MKTTILLVRHGQSEANLAEVFAGHTGHPLTALGHEQAERTAKYLQKTYSINAVYCSDLPRAFQTAEHIANAFGLPVISDARFREIYGGDWEGVPLSQLPIKYPKDYELWKTDVGFSCCTNGETPLHVAERVFDALKEIASMHEGKCVLIATHAMALRTALWKISESSVSSMQAISLGSNCAVNEISFENGCFSVVYTNYVGHLNGCETRLPAGV